MIGDYVKENINTLKKKKISIALSVILFSAAGVSSLRSKRTLLSQSTYACIKVLTQSAKTAGASAPFIKSILK